MSSGDAKTYLSKRNVPALFECLMTGLMFHRPADHLQYLMDCLERVKAKGQEDLRWDIFIQMQRSKTPALPPISPTNGTRPLSRQRTPTPKAADRPDKGRAPTPRQTTPLPAIGGSGDKADINDVTYSRRDSSDDKTDTTGARLSKDEERDQDIPDVPIIFLVGGPGSGTRHQAERLLEKTPGWVTLSTGQLLKQEGAARGSTDTVPEGVVLDVLVSQMKSRPSAEGFLIRGFPRDMEQAQLFDKRVGRVDAVFLLDYEEETLSKQAAEHSRPDRDTSSISSRIQDFKEQTLPVLKHYDDMEKLFILEGEKDQDEIAEDLHLVFETVVGSQGTTSPGLATQQRAASPASGGRADSGRSSPAVASKAEPQQAPQSPQPAPEHDDPVPLPSHLLPPEVTAKDEGRRPGLPSAPIVFVAGGPGSGKRRQCKRLVSRYTDAVHLSMGDILRSKASSEQSDDDKWSGVRYSMKQGELAPEEVTLDLLTEALREAPDAGFFLLEGFPRNLQQLEDFNKHVGGLTVSVLLDCEEETLRAGLAARGRDSPRDDDNDTALHSRIALFQEHTLPILKTLEDLGKLVVIKGDKDDDEIHSDLCKVLDFAVYGKQAEAEAATETKELEPEEIVECMTSAQVATTGGSIANPSYSAQLDDLASAEEFKMREEADKTREEAGPANTEELDSTQQEQAPAESDSQALAGGDPPQEASALNDAKDDIAGEEKAEIGRHSPEQEETGDAEVKNEEKAEAASSQLQDGGPQQDGGAAADQASTLQEPDSASGEVEADGNPRDDVTEAMREQAQMETSSLEGSGQNAEEEKTEENTEDSLSKDHADQKAAD